MNLWFHTSIVLQFHVSIVLDSWFCSSGFMEPQKRELHIHVQLQNHGNMEPCIHDTLCIYKHGTVYCIHDTETWNRVCMIHDVYITVYICTTTEPWKCGTCIHNYAINISIYINTYINLCICICIMNTNPYTNMVPTLLSCILKNKILK